MANIRDLAAGIVVTAPSPATSGTSIVLRAGDGAYFPPVPFYATMTPTGNLSTPGTSEIVLVTARPGEGDTFTITRTQKNTTAMTVVAGWIFSNSIYTDDVIAAGNVTTLDQTPSGTVNSSNTVFTTSTAYIAGTLQVFINGIKKKRTTHFTETTPTTGVFTMGTAPTTGDDIMVNYMTASASTGNADTLDGYHGTDLMPIGTVLPFAGTTIPSGNWLFAYGQAISRTTYVTLFTTLSTTYGVGDGSTTFNIPDMRGRVPAGEDDMGGTSANRLTDPGSTGGMDGDTLGNTGGQQAHAQTTGELAAHAHYAGDYAVNRDLYANSSTGVRGIFDYNGADNRITSSAGSGTAFNVVQPTIILKYIIKAL